MKAEFWHKMWENNTIGFHLPEVNPFLIKYFPHINLKAKSRIFVPLCGKTLDITYILSLGHSVVAIELSEDAIRQLFANMNITPNIKVIGNFKHYSYDELEVYVGDFFELDSFLVGNVDAIYDRAAIVALPIHMRKTYVSKLLEITNQAPQLIISYEYDQNLRQGPPFSVLPSEIKEHYSSFYTLTQLLQHPLNGQKHEQVNAYESVWLLEVDDTYSNLNVVTDINDVQIKEFISLKQSTIDEDFVVVESKNVFKKLFNTNTKIHKVFTTVENIDFIKEFSPNIAFPIFTANNEIMKKIVGHKIHQGMMAVIDKPSFISFEQIKGNVVVLNGLSSPENVGSIARSCAAFGIDTLIIDEKTCSPFIRRCIRVSTGNIFNIKVYKSTNLEKDLKSLQNNGYTVLTTANSPEAISLHQYSFPKNSAIVIGSEGYGAQKEVLDLSDDILKIDIDEEVTSLNAAIAASIVLYQMKNSI